MWLLLAFFVYFLTTCWLTPSASLERLKSFQILWFSWAPTAKAQQFLSVQESPFLRTLLLITKLRTQTRDRQTDRLCVCRQTRAASLQLSLLSKESYTAACALCCGSRHLTGTSQGKPLFAVPTTGSDHGSLFTQRISNCFSWKV